MGNIFNQAGSKSVVGSLRGNPHLSAERAEESLSRIFDLSVKDGTKAAKLAELGVCELIVDVMKKHNHYQNVSVAHQWIKAVSALTRNCDRCWVRFGKAGLCPMLINILIYHSSSADFVEYWCNVVGNMAIQEDNRKELGELGACSALMYVLEQTLKVHPDGNGIAQWVCKATENLCKGNEANKKRFIAAGFPRIAQGIRQNDGLNEQTKAITSRAMQPFLLLPSLDLLPTSATQ